MSSDEILNMFHLLYITVHHSTNSIMGCALTSSLYPIKFSIWANCKSFLLVKITKHFHRKFLDNEVFREYPIMAENLQNLLQIKCTPNFSGTRQFLDKNFQGVLSEHNSEGYPINYLSASSSSKINIGDNSP